MPPPGPALPPPGAPPPSAPPPAWGGAAPPPTGWQDFPPVEPVPGVAHGVPWSKHGAISIDTAGFTDTEAETSLIALVLSARVPLTERFFVTGRVPLAVESPGNIHLGVEGIVKMGARGFLAIGGRIGLPLVQDAALIAFSIPNAGWNFTEYTFKQMPLQLALGYERMLGASFSLRVDLEPALLAPIGDRTSFDETTGKDVGFVLPHAAEIQYGHRIGVGLRYQGVALSDGATFGYFFGQAGFEPSDAYQAALEPFFVVRRDLGFLRLGLMLPLDGRMAGPAFEQSWGLRLSTGVHLD